MTISLVASAVFSFSSLAVGQANQGAIAGTVTDPTGAVVVAAKIVARETSRGTKYETTSSTAGAYRMPNVNIGTYDVTVTSPGFKTATLTGVVVQVATTAALDIKLTTGAVNESIVVSADAPAVESESSDMGAVVMPKQAIELPLVLGSAVQAMRSPEAFVFLIPGTVGYGTGNGSGGTFESKISGGQNYATEVLLDGASMYRSENGSSFDETAPSVEALSEFKVLTSTLPAEFGRTTGGIEAFSTKSGTNTYHGVAYDIFRNDDLDANTWGNDLTIAENDTAATRAAFRTPADKQNDYGLTMGGPVRIPHLYNGKDKTFFFFSWEQYRQTSGGTQTSTVPTAAERTGDFSAVLNTANNLGTNPCDQTAIYQGEIFDPTTTRTVAGVQCRTAFMNEPGSAGNVIPTGNFSTVGVNLIANYPTPTNGALFNNYSFPYSFPIEDTTTTVRIDQNISAKSKAYFTYNSRQNARISTNPEFAGPAGFGRSQSFTTHYIRGGYDYTISSSMLNHLSLGYNRTNSANIGAGVTLGKGTDWDAQLGIGGLTGTMFPAIQFNGSAGEGYSGYGDSVDGDTIDNGYRTNDTLSWVKGKHDFKFGVDWRLQIFDPLNFANTSGTFNFGRNETAGTIVSDSASGDAFASMLLGTVDASSATTYATQPRWVRDYYAVFFQDDFKVAPTFTLSYGLRWDLDEPNREAFGDTSNISLTTPNPGAGGLPGALVFAGKGAGRNGDTNERWANIYKKDFGPRFGFAWAPAMFNNKMVFRGGYGILYGAITYADFGADELTGFQANPSFNTPDGFNPAYNLNSGFPAFTPPPNLSPTQLNPTATGGFQGPTYIDPAYGRPAMIQNWSLEVQKELTTDLILDIAYVGEHSTHLRSNFDAVNSLTPQYLGLPANLLNSTFGSQTTIAAPYAGFPTGALTAQALVPFPQYGGFNTDCCLENLGQSTYNALEASLQRRFHNGLNLMASYTWSKTLTDADSALPYFATAAGSQGPQNSFNKNGDKAISDQDLPQNFVLSYVYDLPFGKNKRFVSGGGVTDRIVGGWSVSGVQRYESGQPIAFGCATGIPAWAGCIRFDQITGSQLASSAYKSTNYNPVTDPIFNPLCTPGTVVPNCAFVDPNSGPALAARGTYAFGDISRVTGAVRMPIYPSEDFNIIKRTKITESKDVLLQASFIDAFNRHVFNRPDVQPYDAAFGFITPSNTL
ncbi:MAG: TonB-dependent receptor, partial [Candidatus Sulfotelmatobacter sp.]